MQVEDMKSRYNLKTGQRELEDYIGSKDIDDNYEHQVLDLFLRDILNNRLLISTLPKANSKLNEEGVN
jgi:hypothetical protein